MSARDLHSVDGCHWWPGALFNLPCRRPFARLVPLHFFPQHPAATAAAAAALVAGLLGAAVAMWVVHRLFKEQRTMTADDLNEPDVRRWQAGVAFGRLIRVHLRIFLEQRFMTVGTAVALVLGLIGTAIAVSVPSASAATAASVGHRFATAAWVYVMAWAAIGAFAGAAPFRSRWAALVLALAPRRPRWLAACYATVLVWAMAATAVFTVCAAVVAAVALARSGRPVGAALGTFTYPWQLALAVAVNVTVGFFLGAATRGTTVTLLTFYVALPLTVAGWGRVGPWVDLDTARNAVTHLAAAPHGLAPAIGALVVWTAGPALLAAVRLRRSAIR